MKITIEPKILDAQLVKAITWAFWQCNYSVKAEIDASITRNGATAEIELSAVQPIGFALQRINQIVRELKRQRITIEGVERWDTQGEFSQGARIYCSTIDAFDDVDRKELVNG